MVDCVCSEYSGDVAVAARLRSRAFLRVALLECGSPAFLSLLPVLAKCRSDLKCRPLLDIRIKTVRSPLSPPRRTQRAN